MTTTTQPKEGVFYKQPDGTYAYWRHGKYQPASWSNPAVRGHYFVAHSLTLDHMRKPMADDPRCVDEFFADQALTVEHGGVNADGESADKLRTHWTKVAIDFEDQEGPIVYERPWC